MGNCIRHESSTQWGGDDWGPIFTEETTTSHVCSVSKNRPSAAEEAALLQTDPGSFKRSDEGSKVKIKITRKKLQEILCRVERKEMTVHQVMVQLVGGGGSGGGEMHHHVWQPALQSIPEIN